MSSNFILSTAIDMSKEREWSASLGMLDWDATNIVFTKRSLIEFLKYTGVTVDPNFTNISKLPRYAQFGQLVVDKSNSETDNASTTPSNERGVGPTDFRPTRRVRTVPGGPHTDIFGEGNHDDALSHAPPKANEPDGRAIASAVEAPIERIDKESGINFPSTIVASRRSRTHTAEGSLAGLWDTEGTEEFKPTRRVRQRPGGEDHINSIF